MANTMVGSAVAGTAGVLAMDIATWLMYRAEAPKRLRQEKRARVFGKDTAHAAARHLARMIGSEAARHEPNAGGVLIHYALGIGPATAYAKLRQRHHWIAAGKGSVWGLGLFIVNDEIAAPLLRLAGPPQRYPWQAHARGLIGHVVLGIATHLILDALQDGPQDLTPHHPSEQDRGRTSPVKARH